MDTLFDIMKLSAIEQNFIDGQPRRMDFQLNPDLQHRQRLNLSAAGKLNLITSEIT
jgi:hypothetical protein